ncbi:hypothetical protein, partial [Staphylococcus nepalensis]|uniref:hypothetical protein n=1 Tax=Staphylococcus nepalensis TaxID=214473 RepID=UPI00285EAE13
RDFTGNLDRISIVIAIGRSCQVSHRVEWLLAIAAAAAASSWTETEYYRDPLDFAQFLNRFLHRWKVHFC